MNDCAKIQKKLSKLSLATSQIHMQEAGPHKNPDSFFPWEKKSRMHYLKGPFSPLGSILGTDPGRMDMGSGPNTVKAFFLHWHPSSITCNREKSSFFMQQPSHQFHSTVWDFAQYLKVIFYFRGLSLKIGTRVLLWGSLQKGRNYYRAGNTD